LSETVAAYITILSTLFTYESWVEYCLALLRPVAIGDFRPPEMIGGYYNVLAMKWLISGKITMC
jgi:hypothetical protein